MDARIDVNVDNSGASDAEMFSSSSFRVCVTSPYTETKYIFRPDRKCTLRGDHHISCSGGNSVQSVTGTPARMKEGYLLRGFHEDDIKNSLIAINHYRFIDFEDIANKCTDSAFAAYRSSDCIETMSRGNHADIFDDIMLRKSNGHAHTTDEPVASTGIM